MLRLENVYKKDATIQPINLSFRKNELVSIRCVNKQDRESLYAMICFENNQIQGNIYLNGYLMTPYINEYRQLHVGTTRLITKNETVLKMMEWELALQGISSQIRLQRIKNALNQISKTIVYSMKFEDLSLYDQWCVRIGKAIVKNPSVVVIDEELEGLSQKQYTQLTSILNELADEYLVIYFGELKNCDREIVVENHHICFDSSPYQIQKEKNYFFYNPQKKKRAFYPLDLVKKHYKKHWLSSCVFLLLCLIYDRYYMISALFTVSIYYFWRKKDLLILKKLGVNKGELIISTYFCFLCSLAISSILCLMVGKFDISNMLLLAGWLLIVNILLNEILIRWGNDEK